MTDQTKTHRFSAPRRWAGLLAAAALTLAACTANPTPEMATEVPGQALTSTPAATKTVTRPATATEPEATATEPEATATEPEATATNTPVPSATATATEAASATPTELGQAATLPAATATSSQTIFTAASVWNVAAAVDTSGCANTFTPPYGLVQITPTDTGLLWHNTVPEDYVFTKLSANTYAYAGPNGIGTGTVTLQVTFTSDTTLELAQTYFSNADPTCAHTYNQAGQFQYFSQ